MFAWAQENKYRQHEMMFAVKLNIILPRSTQMFRFSFRGAATHMSVGIVAHCSLERSRWVDDYSGKKYSITTSVKQLLRFSILHFITNIKTSFRVLQYFKLVETLFFFFIFLARYSFIPENFFKQDLEKHFRTKERNFQ